MIVAIGFVANRPKQGSLCKILVSLIAMGAAGFAMQLASQKPRIKYAGTFLRHLPVQRQHDPVDEQ